MVKQLEEAVKSRCQTECMQSQESVVKISSALTCLSISQCLLIGQSLDLFCTKSTAFQSPQSKGMNFYLSLKDRAEFLHVCALCSQVYHFQRQIPF